MRIILIFIILAIAGGSYVSFLNNKAPTTSLTTMSVRNIDTSNRYQLNILFIGNSYTFINNLPNIIEQLANNDPSSPFVVHTEMLAEGGATLGYFLLNPKKAEKVINSRKWDYVIFQPQSEWANNVSRTKNTDMALSMWQKRLQRKGTKLVFIMTWPRQPKSIWYRKESFSKFKNYQGMHYMLRKHSVKLSKKYDMMLAPIGDYWTYAIQNTKNLQLYSSDGSHAAPEGTLLSALVLYKMLVDPTIDDIVQWPNYIDLQEKRELLKIVSKITKKPFQYPSLSTRINQQ